MKFFHIEINSNWENEFLEALFGGKYKIKEPTPQGQCLILRKKQYYGEIVRTEEKRKVILSDYVQCICRSKLYTKKRGAYQCSHCGLAPMLKCTSDRLRKESIWFWEWAESSVQKLARV